MPTSIVVGYVTRYPPRVKRMRRIGELVGGRQPGIAEAIAAPARRGPLTLLESIETAGHHLRRHILAAVLASGCRCRGGDKATAASAASGTRLHVKDFWIGSKTSAIETVEDLKLRMERRDM
jgi:hypothetical protein